MSTRYPGGFINRSAPVVVGPIDGEGGSAPGVWTLEQAGYYRSKNLWPKPLAIGGLWDWGRNNYGQLGQNDVANRSSSVQVGSLTTWLNIAGGQYHTVATKTDGTLWTWGYNGFGQLGQNNLIYRSSPVQVGALTTWSRVALGNSNHVEAIKTNGTLWAWGYNSYGQLGQNNNTNQLSPVQIGSLTTWSKISCGRVHTVATKTDGTLWSWGQNNYGQLGQNISYSITRSSPVQVGALATWLSIACGAYHTMATKTDGTLWIWGYNGVGQLGQNDKVYRSSPVQVGALTTWLNISGGGSHTIATKTDGTIWAWGNNSGGQLGQGNVASKSSPTQIGALTTWLNIACGGYHTVVTKTDGTLWSWGTNNYGQLSQNDIINRSSPVQVGSLTTWLKLACGSYHTVTIKQ